MLVPPASGRSRFGLATFAIGGGIATAQLGVSCVDGVTPDCSDPAACAPEGDVTEGDVTDGSASPVLDARSKDVRTSDVFEDGDVDAAGASDAADAESDGG